MSFEAGLNIVSSYQFADTQEIKNPGTTAGVFIHKLTQTF